MFNFANKRICVMMVSKKRSTHTCTVLRLNFVTEKNQLRPFLPKVGPGTADVDPCNIDAEGALILSVGKLSQNYKSLP